MQELIDYIDELETTIHNLRVDRDADARAEILLASGLYISPPTLNADHCPQCARVYAG